MDEREDALLENEDLLSDSADDFIEKPDTSTVLRKVAVSKDEPNVCVAIDNLESDGNLVRALLQNLTQLCLVNHKITETHRVAVLSLLNESGKMYLHGYCDELSARNIIFRLCQISGVKAKVYRDYGKPTVEEITEEDLGKRPFRF